MAHTSPAIKQQFLAFEEVKLIKSKARFISKRDERLRN
uniref:Uncharacterized protein n=1 Tax=Manihot esculenta TaxID=3983 RepID=A0A2C9VLG7_MANES